MGNRGGAISPAGGMTMDIFSQTNQNTKMRSKTLQYVVKRCIIREVRDRLTKGGCCDNYGGTYHRQGGVARTGTLHLSGERNAPRQLDAWISRRQRVAHYPIPVRGMEKDETQTESVSGVSGKLKQFFSSTSAAYSFSGLSRRRCSRYLIVYSISIRLASPVRTDEIRQGVAVREEIPL